MAKLNEVTDLLGNQKLNRNNSAIMESKYMDGLGGSTTSPRPREHQSAESCVSFAPSFAGGTVSRDEGRGRKTIGTIATSPMIMMTMNPSNSDLSLSPTRSDVPEFTG